MEIKEKKMNKLIKCPVCKFNYNIECSDCKHIARYGHCESCHYEFTLKDKKEEGGEKK